VQCWQARDALRVPTPYMARAQTLNLGVPTGCWQSGILGRKDGDQLPEGLHFSKDNTTNSPDDPSLDNH
jgi:hypothetical protein